MSRPDWLAPLYEQGDIVATLEAALERAEAAAEPVARAEYLRQAHVSGLDAPALTHEEMIDRDRRQMKQLGWLLARNRSRMERRVRSSAPVRIRRQGAARARRAPRRAARRTARRSSSRGSPSGSSGDGPAPSLALTSRAA